MTAIPAPDSSPSSPGGLPSRSSKLGSGGPTPGRGERILFVDDDAEVCAAMAASLTRLGFRVVVQVDPFRALAKFREDPRYFDLIITDIAISELSGVEFANRVCQLHPGIPVVLLTESDYPWSARGKADRGLYHVLKKPVNTTMLAALIRNLMDEQRRRAGDEG